jgi:hypothetical protein
MGAGVAFFIVILSEVEGSSQLSLLHCHPGHCAGVTFSTIRLCCEKLLILNRFLQKLQNLTKNQYFVL